MHGHAQYRKQFLNFRIVSKFLFLNITACVPASHIAPQSSTCFRHSILNILVKCAWLFQRCERWCVHACIHAYINLCSPHKLIYSAINNFEENIQGSKARFMTTHALHAWLLLIGQVHKVRYNRHIAYTNMYWRRISGGWEQSPPPIMQFRSKSVSSITPKQK